MSKKRQMMQSLMNNIEKVSKADITIIDTFKYLIPPLSEEEFRALERNILREGCREPLIVWKKSTTDLVLIDGHNRYAICTKHGISYEIETKEFDNEEAAKAWALNNQLGRRNLTAEQLSYIRGKRYEVEKTTNKFRGNQYLSENENIAEQLAQEYNTADKTIKRDAFFAKGLDKIGSKNLDLKHEILTGTSKITKAQIQKVARFEGELPHLGNVEDLLAFIASISTTQDVVDELPTNLPVGYVEIEKILQEQLATLKTNLSPAEKKHVKNRLIELIRRLF
jgi:hypothetical protein